MKSTCIGNVGITMMLKSEAVSHELLGNKYTDEAEQYYDILKKYNGTPVEIFTGDEHLAGLSPIHGTELCSVVELMYSYELLYAIRFVNVSLGKCRPFCIYDILILVVLYK